MNEKQKTNGNNGLTISPELAERLSKGVLDTKAIEQLVNGNSLEAVMGAKDQLVNTILDYLPEPNQLLEEKNLMEYVKQVVAIGNAANERAGEIIRTAKQSYGKNNNPTK